MSETDQKILIVDDEPALLKMIGLYLKRVGYVVTTMDSADRAWAAVENSVEEHAAAVIDATMTGMGSVELARRLLAASPSLRVIVTSGYPVDMSAMDAAAPGRVSFVQKPFTADTLIRTLRRLLGAEEKAV
jgi:DNA-binding NtrC family response regulator